MLREHRRRRRGFVGLTESQGSFGLHQLTMNGGAGNTLSGRNGELDINQPLRELVLEPRVERSVGIHDIYLSVNDRGMVKTRQS